MKQLIEIVVAMLSVVEYGLESDTPFQLNWPAFTDAGSQLTLEAVRCRLFLDFHNSQKETSDETQA